MYFCNSGLLGEQCRDYSMQVFWRILDGIFWYGSNHGTYNVFPLELIRRTFDVLFITQRNIIIADVILDFLMLGWYVGR